MEVHKVKELYNGSHFYSLLDFPTNNVVNHLLSDEYKYVWVINYNAQSFDDWRELHLPLTLKNTNTQLLAKQISFDFILPTRDFKSILPTLSKGITAIQINKLPPQYLDLRKLEGKSRYDLLQRECDYLFEIDIAYPTDYSTLISSDKAFLESFLSNKELDFTNLP